MEFATKDQVEQFYRDVPDFERMLIRSGIILLKYWFSISDEEQQLRFLMRANDPLKQWKLSDVDLMARIHWEKYTCLLYTSPSPRDQRGSRMPSSA